MCTVWNHQPIRTAAVDGSELRTLPICAGGLALSPQRVISRDNDVVFTSSAPAGPTFAAAANDVYLMNLDGSDLRQVAVPPGRFRPPKRRPNGLRHRR